MKIVLRQDVPKVGEAGTVQTVANGYARNYLIPQGLAVPATKGELKTAEHNLAVKARKVAKQEEQLQSLADRIAGKRLAFEARAGEQGRLYGSITAGDIAEKLTALVGEEIDRRKVVLDESIRTVGEHNVAIHLVGRLRPEVVVVVTAEVDEAAVAAAAEAAAAEAAAAEAAAAEAASEAAGDEA
jgi:large subunit ribosomal protein L9